jgi:hypothetical protein
MAYSCIFLLNRRERRISSVFNPALGALHRSTKSHPEMHRASRREWWPTWATLVGSDMAAVGLGNDCCGSGRSVIKIVIVVLGRLQATAPPPRPSRKSKQEREPPRGSHGPKGRTGQTLLLAVKAITLQGNFMVKPSEFL